VGAPKAGGGAAAVLGSPMESGGSLERNVRKRKEKRKRKK
jgi:hypothetical protein